MEGLHQAPSWPGHLWLLLVGIATTASAPVQFTLLSWQRHAAHLSWCKWYYPLIYKLYHLSSAVQRVQRSLSKRLERWLFNTQINTHACSHLTNIMWNVHVYICANVPPFLLFHAGTISECMRHIMPTSVHCVVQRTGIPLLAWLHAVYLCGLFLLPVYLPHATIPQHTATASILAWIVKCQNGLVAYLQSIMRRDK